MVTITFGMWLIPTTITILALLWAFFYVDGGDGYLSGLANIFALVPALFVSCIAWMLYAIFK